MSICPVCGCKTDELDFVPFSFGEAQENICSFCEKQLKKIESSDELALAQARWLDSVLDKAIPSRSQEISFFLGNLKPYSEPEEVNPEPAEQVLSPTNTARSGNVSQPFTPPTQSTITPAQYNDLLNRLNSLEQAFNKYKKAQLMKTIFELGAPVILLIIIIIVLLSSGIFDQFSSLFGMY